MDGAGLVILMVSALTGFLLVSSHQICYIESEYDPKSDNPHIWVLPYKDPCTCTAIRLGGMNTHSVSYRQRASYYLDKLIFSEYHDEIQKFFGCSVGCLDPEPLGLEDGTIPDDRITTSSTGLFSGSGRLNDLGWAPNLLFDTNPWIEVDLSESTLVSGVVTQCAATYNARVKYRVKYQKLPGPSSHYDYVTDDQGEIQVFDGNTDASTPVTNTFHESIVAAQVRIEPVAWVVDGGAAMRLELLGCRIN